MREDLPTGVVTFLFTDVEGSTRLLDELGAGRYGALLGDHHRVCRAAWAANGGVEVDTAGDALFVAFARPAEALAAAGEAQRALADLGLSVSPTITSPVCTPIPQRPSAARPRRSWLREPRCRSTRPGRWSARCSTAPRRRWTDRRPTPRP